MRRPKGKLYKPLHPDVRYTRSIEAAKKLAADESAKALRKEPGKLVPKTHR